MKVSELILHNFRLKLFALIIAVLVWETVHLAINRNGEDPFPVLHLTPTNSTPQ